MAALGLCCCPDHSPGVRGLLLAVASFVEHCSRVLALSSGGNRLSCSTSCAVFLNQESNPGPCIGRQILNQGPPGTSSSTQFVSVCFFGVEFSLGYIDAPLRAVSFANILFHSVGDLFASLIFCSLCTFTFTFISLA